MNKIKVYKKIAKQICKGFDVKVTFQNVNHVNKCGGHAFAYDSEIHLRLNKSMKKSIFLSILFHEITHCILYREGKFEDYHSPKLDIFTLKNKIFTGLKAEKYTDKRAKILMKKLFPKYKYYAYYENENNCNDYRRIYLGNLRNLLDQKIYIYINKNF